MRDVLEGDQIKDTGADGECDIPATIVRHSATVEVEIERDEYGIPLGCTPIPGTYEYTMDVRLPNGSIVTANLDEENYNRLANAKVTSLNKTVLNTPVMVDYYY